MRHLSLATTIAALAGWGILLIAGWTLGEERYAQFQAFWGLFFALTGILDGFAHETTRSISSSTPKRGVPLWLVALSTGIALALLCAFSSPWWMPDLVDHSRSATTLLVIGVLSYAFQALVAGVVSGLGLWARYGTLIAVDSLIRLVVAVAAWAMGWGLGVFLVVTVLGAGSWMVILKAEFLRYRADCSTPIFLRRLGFAMLASGSSALLMAGFPALLQLTVSDNSSRTGVGLGAIMLAVSLSRAPIIVPLQRFHTALIRRTVRDQDGSFLVTTAAVIVAIGALGAVLAYLIGPQLMVALMGSEQFWVPAGLLATLTLAAACTGVLYISGTSLLALGLHGVYMSGWAAASLVTIACLLLPGSIEVVVGTAMLVGPISGWVIHAWGLRTRAQRTV